MRARQRLSKLLLRHDVRYEDTASAWTVAHRAWQDRPGPARRAADTAGVPRGDRRDRDPPRRAGESDRRADSRLAVATDRRQAAVPARDRHAVGGRTVRRDRRLRTI